jgi:hypothetical protein
MAQQTSVEWIYNELVVFMNGNSVFETAQELLSHAEDKHLEELGNAYEQGWKDASIEAMKEMHKYQ